VLSDTAWVSEDVPALTYGLRGIAFFEAKVKGPNRDLHSGRFGGLVQNPLNAIAFIISKFHDASGKIAIPHIYDDVVDISDEERTEFKKLGDNEDELRKYLDVQDLWGEKGFTTYERNWARPCLDVNGIWGGYAGEGSKTVIPSDGGFKFSVRLVPNQTPEKVRELVLKYVKEITPPGVTVTVEYLHGGPPALVPITNPFLQTARRALEKGFGKPTILVRDAASVPIVGTFKEALGAVSILMGFDVPTGNIHAPNENFKLAHFSKGMVSAVYFYTEAGNK
jgi:acetylornithine deacetylase/succinyl-diaminopimelate desuccinylase-like protein